MVPDPWTLGVPERKASPPDMLDLGGANGPLGCSPYVARRITEAAGAACGAWRDGLAGLTTAISRKYSVAEDRVSLGAGARALLPAALRALCPPGAPLALSGPPPPLHRLAAAQAGLPVVEARLSASFGHALEAWTALLEQHAPPVALLAHPCNPGGQGLTREEADALLAVAAQRGTLVIVDEAYGDYAERAEFARLAPLLDEAPHLVLVRSLSSTQGLSGLPAAWALSSAETADRLRPHLLGLEPGEVAARAAQTAVEEPSFDHVVRECVGRTRFMLANVLREWGVKVQAGVAPWVLAEVGDSTDATRRLAARGLRVRDLAPWGFPGWIRIRAGTEDEAARFLRDGKTVLKKGPR